MAVLRGFPPSNTISPSVRISELDLSFIEPPRTLHRAGIVGFASKGPINIPTLIQTTRQLNNTFGFPHPQEGDPYLIYAGQQYLLIANELFVVRVGDEEAVSDEAATVAEVDIPSAGGQIEVCAEVAGTVGTPYVFDDDVFFRWKINGVLKSNTLVALADSYSGEELASTLNEQLSASFDGIQFFADSSDIICVRTTFAFGPDSELEFVSVQDALYGGTVANRNLVGTNFFPGLGTGMTVAKSTSGAEGFTDTGSVVTPGEWDFTGLTNVNLQIVIDGTDNVNIDNVNQVIDLDDVISTLGPVLTTAEIATEINSQISDGTIPGGFEAAGDGVTGPSLVTAGGDSAADNLTLRTLHHGRDAKLLVKSDSTANDIFEWDNITAEGLSPQGTAGEIGESTFGRINGASNTTGVVTFTLTADSSGIEGNNTQAVITNDIADGTFQIQVFNNGANVESFGTLTKDETSSFYIGTILDLASDFLRATDNTDTAAPPLDGTYDLSGGSDGIPSDPDEQDSLLIGNPLDFSGMFAFSEPEQINIDLLSVPGHPSTSVILSMIEVVESRQDALAIIDPPFGLTVSEIVDWQNGVHPLNGTRFDTNFAALYWPWLKLRDTFNRVDVWVPPSGSVLAVYARSDQLSAPWFAPAGATRGLIPAVTDVFSRPTLAERDTMYGNRNAVNPIVQFTDIDGFLVFGQKTLQRRTTALDRVNVRRMLFFVEKEIRRRSRRLLFEPNDEIFRERFIAMATEVLQGVQVGRGITNFIIKADAELNTPDVIDRNEFRARIGIIPTRAVEFIFLEFSLHRTGSDFTESTEF
jgi:hypothetical protein